MKDKKYFSNLEVLRGIACMMVVVFHFATQESYYGHYLSETNWVRVIGQYGYVGVQIFFVISGFIIPYSLGQNEYTLQSFPAFMKKRLWRIWPPYAVAVFLALGNVILHAFLWKKPYTMEWMNLLLHFVYAPTFFGYEWYNILFWTLAIEFQFYIVIGLLFPLLIQKRKLVTIATLSLFGVSFFVLKDNRFLTSQSALFLFGIIAFLFYIKKITLVEFILMILLDAVLFTYQYGEDRWLVLAISLASVLIILIGKMDFKAGREIGKISYSLYLLHGIFVHNILILSMRLEVVQKWEWLRTCILLIGILIAIACSYLYWYLIERPSQEKSSQVLYK